MKAKFSTANWDSLLPLGTIAGFILLGIPVALGVIDFGLDGAGASRYQTIYTDIGIQTTAGIFAIVISLSLVAIQFAAQEYSHRIMEYYIKSSVFWSTVAVYLALMIAAIFLQAGSSDDDSPRVVGLVLVGSVLALALLVPHFIVTAAFLKPEFIVEKLMRRITPRYLERVESDTALEIVGTSRDRLLPVIEIAERSIEKGDVATANSVVTRFVDRYESAASSGGASNATLAAYFTTDLKRIGRKAISDSDEEPVAVQVVKAVAQIARSGGLPQAASTIDDLLFAAVRHQQEGTISEGINALAELYSKAEPDVKGNIDDSLGGLIPRGARDGQRLLSLQLISRLEEMIEMEVAGEAAHTRLIELLESVGRESALNRMVGVVRAAAVSLAAIGKRLAEDNPDAARSVVLALLRVERSIDQSDASSVAAVGFARSDVERLLADKPESGSGESFSDLWDEPENK